MSFKVISKENVFEVYHNDYLFTVCDYSSTYKRPFMGPVNAPDGVSFTRFEPFHKEHPHQRSLFIGVGDVNGVDFWNEFEEDKGVIVFDSVDEISDGETAVVAVNNVWQKPDGTPVINENRRFTYSETENGVRVDVRVVFTAAYGDIEFGATKEAGPLGIRVNDFMRADAEGTFVNSNGGVKEEECWGKEALWCNYSAEQNGKTYGIAAFDRNTNERFPTTWHIRNYGLMAANNLFFKGGLSIPANESLQYDFTVVFWTDSIDESKYSE